MSTASSVRLAKPADIADLATSFQRAFHADPFYDWVLPAGPRRAAAFVGFFRLILRQLSDDLQNTFTTADRSGAAVWLAPGKQRLSWWRQARLVPSFTRVVGLDGIPRGLRIIAYMDALHERALPEPHYTLSLIGVDPSAQGRGLGRRLLEPIVERCDHERLPMYVDTAQAHNVPFYERFGFVVHEEAKHPEFPKFWSMTRAPR